MSEVGAVGDASVHWVRVCEFGGRAWPRDRAAATGRRGPDRSAPPSQDRLAIEQRDADP